MGMAGRKVATLRGIQRVSPTRVSDQVVEQIRSLILEERLAGGERLPPERDLAAMFGVSRPMVSQALRMLALMGLVEIRQGSGAYVLRRPQAMVTASVRLMLDADSGSLADLADLRLWLETVGVVRATEREPPLAPHEMADIHDTLQHLADSTGSAPAWIAADTVFHATAVGAGGNSYLTALYEGVHTAVLSREYEHWVRTETQPSWLISARAGVLLDIHRRIYDAIAAGDGSAARVAVRNHHEAMLEHLAAARSRPPGTDRPGAMPG
jgi:GntR family transcriptional repressor for pyruvate dehydrogenase complex